jgi:hypothetical protein
MAGSAGDAAPDAPLVSAEPDSTTTLSSLPAVAVPVTVPATLPSVPVPVTLPKIALPKLPRPRPSTTTTSTAPQIAKAPSVNRCGTPWGYGGFGASHTVTEGQLTVLLGIVDCEHYDGEFMQTHLEISDPGSLLRSMRVDFGDGTTAYDVSGSSWTCDSPNRPNPFYGSAPFHTYAASGAYTVTASVTTSSCSAWADTHQLVDDRTITVTITTYQIAGRRPA